MSAGEITVDTYIIREKRIQIKKEKSKGCKNNHNGMGDWGRGGGMCTTLKYLPSAIFFAY